MSPPASDGGMASTMPSAADAMSGTFGAGCAAVPESGAGSFDGMARTRSPPRPSNNPALSTLVTAVTKAEAWSTH